MAAITASSVGAPVRRAATAAGNDRALRPAEMPPRAAAARAACQRAQGHAVRSRCLSPVGVDARTPGQLGFVGSARVAQRQIDRLGLVIPINAAVEHANPQRTSLRHTLRRFWPPQFPHSPRVMPSAQQTTSPSRTMYARRSGRAGLLRFPRPLHPLERPRPCRHCSRCRLSVIAVSPGLSFSLVGPSDARPVRLRWPPCLASITNRPWQPMAR